MVLYFGNNQAIVSVLVHHLQPINFILVLGKFFVMSNYLKSDIYMFLFI